MVCRALFMAWFTVCLPVFAEFTFLNDADKHSSIILSEDQLGAEFTIWGHHGVRSTRGIAPGSGFYYFEGTREVDIANYGFGVATAAAPLDTHGGATDQSLGINMNNGTILMDGNWQGNVPGTPDTYGFAVDYRGANPIVHVIASTAPGGEGAYIKSITMTVTEPVYILVYGNKSHGLVQQTVNAGDHQGPSPFVYDARAILTASWHYFENLEDLHLGWGEPDPNLNRFPQLTLDSERVVIAGNPLTVNGSATDFEDGNLTKSINWSQTAGPETEVGGSFTLTPPSPGSLQIQARVTDSHGAPTTASIQVTVISNGGVDSDADGLSYDQETTHNTDPANPDTDGDGLSDGDEVLLHLCNPLSVDSDGDTMPDGFEALCGTYPNLDDRLQDPDGDGFNNLEEFNDNSEPLSHLSYPGQGDVFLNSEDKHPSVTVGSNGLGATFTAAGVHGVRSDIAVAPGSGWYYFEGYRTGTTGDFGFGVASATAPLDEAGGATDQSMGVNALGQVTYNGIQMSSFPGPTATSYYGLALDYSGSTPTVYPIVNDAAGLPVVLAGVDMTGVTTPVHILVYGSPVVAGIQQTINAGANPEGNPFYYAAAYQLFMAGETDAEFLGSGWGPDHSYSGVEEPTSFNPVKLVVDPSTGAGIKLGPDGLGASYSVNQKMAVRANQGMIGEFRYFEARRSVGPFNIGQGLITKYGVINPYCCVSASLDGAPPSMSVNSSSSIWRNLVSQATYNINNDTYGFAVDYRAARPTVYVIIGDSLAHTMIMDDVFTPLYPMLYANPQGDRETNTVNFGSSPFTYDVRQILTDQGVDTTQLITGWGDANNGATPSIVGQTLATINEDEGLALQLSHILVNDPNSSYPTGFSLSAGDGTNYTRSGNTITPVENYNGKLAVPVTVSDGLFTSRVFKLIIEVTSVNDPPLITGQESLETWEEQTITPMLSNLIVEDVDNLFPDDFTLHVLDGDHYTHNGNEVTPDQDFNGSLPVSIKVNDGQDDSSLFNLMITVTPTNDPPLITDQLPLNTDEETELTLTLADFNITDPDNNSGDWLLTIGDGDHYSRSGNSITPETDYNQTLTVPVTVSDGQDVSEVFNAQVTVTPVNDIPQITGQTILKTQEDTPFTLLPVHLLVNDPDNNFPGDFTLSSQDGLNYSRIGNTLTPDPGFLGTLTITTTVEDGQDTSPPFDVELTVCRAPSISQNPSSETRCSGESATLSITATGPEPITYQWHKDGVPLDGQNTHTLNLANLSPDDGGDYYCVVANSCDQELSTSATLTVNEPIQLTAHPQNTEICPEDSVELAVTAEGTLPITYQWRKDGAPLPGETSDRLLIDPVTEADAGGYDCVVTNSCGQETSSTAILTVEGPLNVRINPGSIGSGLSPIQFFAEMSCVAQGSTWEWEEVTSGAIFGIDENPVVIDPMPQETTVYRITVTDGLSRETVSAEAIILVPLNSNYLDLNGDGCNTAADLQLLFPDWNKTLPDDPNGDGMMDLRDLMYINTRDLSCPLL